MEHNAPGHLIFRVQGQHRHVLLDEGKGANMPEGAKSARSTHSLADGDEAVFAVDEKLNITLANDAARALLNVTPGMHASKSRPAWASLVSELADAVQADKSFDRLMELNGSSAPYHVSADACHGAAVVRVRCATPVDPVIGALGLRAAALAPILDASGMGVFVLDTACVFVAATPNFAAMLEYTPDELIGRNVRSVMHAEDIVIAPLQCPPAVEKPHILEKRFMSKSGSVVFVRMAAMPVPASPPEDARLLCCGYQITAAKLREQRLQQSEWRFRSIVENMEDVVTIADADGVITYVNPAAERILGYRPEERLGRRVWDLVHSADVDNVKREWANCISLYGSRLRLTARLRPKEGPPRTVDVLGLNMLHNPAVAGVVIISHDISDRMAARDRMRDYTLELEQRNRELLQHMAAPARLAVSGILEEIHTPLVGANRLVDLLLATRLDASQRECTEHVQDSILHLLKVVEQMLVPAANARSNGNS